MPCKFLFTLDNSNCYLNFFKVYGQIFNKHLNYLFTLNYVIIVAIHFLKNQIFQF